MKHSFKRSLGSPDHSTEQGYEAQFLYKGESATIIASTVRAHGSAPAHHLHEYSDQLYYVTRGEMKIQLGSEVHTVGPETLVYIPRGTPHHNWNEGEEDEFHFEVLSPSPLPTQPIATATDSTESDGKYIVRPLADTGFTEVMPGFYTSRVLQRNDGAENMAMYVGKVEAGGSGPSTHVHEFDQFYYILEGELTVEVALQRFTAKPNDLVILPAGVPHRQWNATTATERHLTLLVPEPLPGDEWDVSVTFAAEH